jgi:hypothetical protein
MPISRLEAFAVPDIATVQVEPIAGAAAEYYIMITPKPDVPIGPFRFAVPVRAVTSDGAVHPCAAIDASGEMQPSTRVTPRLVLLGERPVRDRAEAEVRVRLPANGWAIDRVEADSAETTVCRVGTGSDGEALLRVVQRITRAGDRVSPIRIIVRKPDRQTEAVTVEVRYHGLAGSD